MPPCVLLLQAWLLHCFIMIDYKIINTVNKLFGILQLSLKCQLMTNVRFSGLAWYSAPGGTYIRSTYRGHKASFTIKENQLCIQISKNHKSQISWYYSHFCHPNPFKWAITVGNKTKLTRKKKCKLENDLKKWSGPNKKVKMTLTEKLLFHIFPE